MARPVLWASLAAGASYLLTIGAPHAGSAVIAWKGSGVALLALYAAICARDLDGWLLAVVMALGALGDVLLDAAGMIAGAAAFAAGHVVAILLYLRNRRPRLATSQKWLATLTLPLGVLIAVWSVPFDVRAQVGIYASICAAMAAAAWISRFPRYRTGLGAMMFLASDLLIFARMGPLAGAGWAGFAIWALYYGGQALIALGVTQRLAENESV